MAKDKETTTTEETSKININDMGWTDYVLSLLTKEEKDSDNNPTTDGLRRIAYVLLGPFNILPPMVHHITEDSAAVTSHIQFLSTTEFSPFARTICASADVNVSNTDQPYSKYPLATAETRAIGRAIKIALNLKRIITAEETSRQAAISSNFNSNMENEGLIRDTQIKFIDLVCKKHNISVEKLVKYVVGDVNKIKELTYQQSQAIQAKIDEWVRTDTIPVNDIGGYDSSWSTLFL